MTLADRGIAPLHSMWEYLNAKRVMESLRCEDISLLRPKGTFETLAEYRELQARIVDYTLKHFPLP